MVAETRKIEREPKGQIKYIGFDKDGTLFDSIPSYARIWGEIFHKDYGIDAKQAENFLLKTSGAQTRDQVRDLLLINGISISEDEAIKKAREIALELGERAGSKLFPEVEEILKKLKVDGYKIFVSSSQQEEVIRRDLETSGISKYIDFYAGVRPQDPSYKKGKPHFKAAAEHFGIPFEDFVKEAVFLGDTPSDLKAASESNIPAIIRKSSNADERLLDEGAKFVLEDFSNLPEIIASFN